MTTGQITCWQFGDYNQNIKARLIYAAFKIIFLYLTFCYYLPYKL